MKNDNLLLLDSFGSLDKTLHWRLVIARRKTCLVFLTTVRSVGKQILAWDTCREVIGSTCIILIQRLTLIV